MASLERSYSYGDYCYGDEGYEEKPIRKKSKSNSIFASAWSLLVGNENDKTAHQDAEDTPDAAQEPKREAGLTHEDAWMQGSYTALAFLFILLTVCIFVAVYYILEPFLLPLVWAVLVGMVLHPFKHATTSEVHSWLSYLDTAGIPLSVGLVLSPLFSFNWLAQCLENNFFSHWKMVFGVLVCIVSIVIGFQFSLPVYIYKLTQSSLMLCNKINSILIHTTWLQVGSLVLGFLLLLLMSNSSHKTALKVLSVCLWFIALLNIGTYLFGSLAIPAVCALFVASIIASCFEMAKNERNKKKSDKVHFEETLLEKGLSLENLRLLSAHKSELEVGLKGTELQSDVDVNTQEQSSDEEPSDRKQVLFNPSARVKITTPVNREDSQFKISDLDPELIPALKRSELPSKPSNDEHSESMEEIDGGRPISPHKDSLKARAQSNQIFLVLVIACLLVVLWKHPIFTLLLIPFAIWSIIKYTFTLAVVKNSVMDRFSNSSQTSIDWFLSQDKIFFPWPMPMMYTIYLFIDKKVLEGVKKSIGSLASALIIVLLLVVVLAVAVLLVFQIQVEVMHYASAAVSVWNSTVATNPQITEWIGVTDANETLQTTLENFANENYAFAREKLAGWIHTLVIDSSSDTTVMERRVLELFDKLYNMYVVQNTSLAEGTESVIADEGLVSDSDGSILGTFSELLPHIGIGTTVAVLSSLWSILSDNMAVAFSFLYTLLQLLFSGGTFLINSIVFLTALFYLLSYSEQDYLPVKWVMDLFPHLALSPNDPTNGAPIEVGVDGDKKKHGKTFARAVRSVFHATFRRAFFYGVYTWLTHTLFGLPVAILPAVVAGIAGAIPFIGAYWVALPAVLELWLLQGQLLSALALFTLSLLPLLFVDTLINREIEGGHPYLTGLAIAGGIYFAGLQGALIGPILLSCLLFVVDFYGDSFF